MEGKQRAKGGIVVGDGFFCTVHPSLLLFHYIYIYCNLVYASIAAHVFSSNGAPTLKRTGRRLKTPVGTVHVWFLHSNFFFPDFDVE